MILLQACLLDRQLPKKQRDKDSPLEGICHSPWHFRVGKSMKMEELVYVPMVSWKVEVMTGRQTGVNHLFKTEWQVFRG